MEVLHECWALGLSVKNDIEAGFDLIEQKVKRHFIQVFPAMLEFICQVREEWAEKIQLLVTPSQALTTEKRPEGVLRWVQEELKACTTIKHVAGMFQNRSFNILSPFPHSISYYRPPLAIVEKLKIIVEFMYDEFLDIEFVLNEASALRSLWMLSLYMATIRCCVDDFVHDDS